MAVVVAFAAACAQVVDYAVWRNAVRALDMNTHASVFGVVSLFALAIACGASIRLAATRASGVGRWGVAGLSLLPALLVVVLGLRVVHPTRVNVLSLPFVVAAFAVLWWDAGAPRVDAGLVIRWGCALLAGSYLARVLGPSGYSAGGYVATSWPGQLTLVVQHSSELAGWIVVAIGLLAAHASCERLSPDPIRSS